MAYCPEEERWAAAAGGGRPGPTTGSDGARRSRPRCGGGGGALPLPMIGRPREVGMTVVVGRTDGPMGRERGRPDERVFLLDDRRQPMASLVAGASAARVSLIKREGELGRPRQGR